MGVDTCFGCSERYEACHSHCQRYLLALEEYRNAKSQDAQQREISATIQGLHIKRRETRKR